MNEGRALVVPTAIGLGLRPLAVPGRGPVMVVSSFYAFRISDHASVRPAEWYEAVAIHAGPLAIPDSLCPLPGAEVVVLGPAAPVSGGPRPARIECGRAGCSLRLHADPEQPESPVALGPSRACWHADDNPVGRGGPGDDRTPLLVCRGDPDRPVWPGPTPFDHPLRLRCAGTPDVSSGAGWASDADPAVFFEAHPALRTERLDPGTPVELEGIAAETMRSAIPPYRITLTIGNDDGRFVPAQSRIHTLALIPRAGIGAAFWRSAIDVGDDMMGERIVAVVAALEDAGAEVRAPEHWARIALDRWLEPHNAVDDRPLLPPDLARLVTLPFAAPDDDSPIAQRRAAAEQWVREEMGVPDRNPFGEGPEAALLDEAQAADDSGERPPDPGDMAEIADRALAMGRKRHADAGFPERSAEDERTPELRGPALAEEIATRLAEPYASPRERVLARTVRDMPARSADPDETLARLASARVMSPQGPAPWPRLDDAEAARFGEALVERLGQEPLPRHADISGCRVAGDPGEVRIEDAHFDGLLAEETYWTCVVFSRCSFSESTFAGATFVRCVFESCRLERTNLSGAELVECTFRECEWRDLHLTEPTWVLCAFEDSTLRKVSLTDVAVREVTVAGGSWQDVSVVDAMWIEVAMSDVALENVAFADANAPDCRFERVTLTRVWVTAKGFAGAVFDDVVADTCGFLNHARFDGSRISRSRFIGCGFSGAILSDATFDASCSFQTCDFSGAAFVDTSLSGVHFVQCTFQSSKWKDVDASDAWLYRCGLRGLDLRGVVLTRAVLADSDLEGTQLAPGFTIGTDLRGTVLDDT